MTLNVCRYIHFSNSLFQIILSRPPPDDELITSYRHPVSYIRLEIATRPGIYVPMYVYIFIFTNIHTYTLYAWLVYNSYTKLFSRQLIGRVSKKWGTI
jgi:hypothetical protein